MNKKQIIILASILLILLLPIAEAKLLKIFSWGGAKLTQKRVTGEYHRIAGLTTSNASSSSGGLQGTEGSNTATGGSAALEEEFRIDSLFYNGINDLYVRTVNFAQKAYGSLLKTPVSPNSNLATKDAATNELLTRAVTQSPPADIVFHLSINTWTSTLKLIYFKPARVGGVTYQLSNALTIDQAKEACRNLDFATANPTDGIITLSYPLQATQTYTGTATKYLCIKTADNARVFLRHDSLIPTTGVNVFKWSYVTPPPQPECTSGATRACNTGEQGICSAGTQTCQSTSQWGSCARNTGSTTETCDGQDNDCDGTPDDNIGSTSAPCTAGTGICEAHGTTTTACSNGQMTTSPCNAVAGQPGTEACDGLDNDCDGDTDEGLASSTPCTAGVGPCERPGTTTTSCTGGHMVTNPCDAVAGQPGTEQCGDGIDQNCDGSDEACPPLAAGPVLIQAESYVNAYDKTKDNAADKPSVNACSRRDDVDIAPGGTGCIIGWTDNGEWLEYDVVVPQAGTYNFEFSVGSAHKWDAPRQGIQLFVGGSCKGLVGGGSAKDLAVIPDCAARTRVGRRMVTNLNVPYGSASFFTSSWSAYTTVTLPNIQLSQGSNRVKLVFTRGFFNFDFFTVRKA